MHDPELMAGLSGDFLAEVEELGALLEPLSPADWQRPTLFKGWTIEDVLLHLHSSNEFALLALTDPAGFEVLRPRVLQERQGGSSPIAGARLRYPGLGGGELLARWPTASAALAEAAARLQPEAAVAWFGPALSVQSLLASRLMETWAHGQEVWDELGQHRPATDRLRHVALLGVKTYRWSFGNRGLEPPGPAPAVRLQAPSGALWQWNAQEIGSSICGTAEDFCQVVTQVRHVDDTQLVVTGDAARRWMAIAQCFAGPPSDPPPAGLRRCRVPH